MTFSRYYVFIPAILSIVLSAFFARADTSIVVNIGTYHSAEAAGNSETKVDWLDADPLDDTVCTEAFAALELQKYLRKMTGRENDFTIVDDDCTPEGELIVVGSSASNATAARLAAQLDVTAEEIEKLGPEGYRLKTGEANGRQVTLVAGGGRAGTLFGVYDLLHRMGCRWFSPADFDEDIPRTEWNPKYDVAERPSFETRGFRIPQKRGGPPIYHWIARHRLNLWCLDRENEPLQRKLGISKLSCGGHYTQEKFLNPLLEYRYNHPRFDGDEQKPIDPWPVSESYQGDANGDGRLTYFEAHPEWFALIDKKRVCNDVHLFGSANFCTSSDEAVAEYLGNFVREFVDGEYRGASVVEAWTIDGGRWCQCPKCKALGSPTDRYLRLINQLDKAIKRAQRKGLINWPIDIQFLVYADVLNPPTRPLPEDFDYKTCMGQFFPIKRCYVHRFNDPNCERNAHFQQKLQGWIASPDRHYRGRLCFGEYYDYSRFENLPVCYMHVMEADIPYYRQIGAARFHYHHAPTGRWGSKSLTACQMARQAWDVETDCGAFWDDYFARRYGPTAAVMRCYYGSLERMLCNVQLLRGWSPSLCTRLNRGQKPLFATSHMRQCREPGVETTGPTFDEMVDHGRQCRKLIDEARTLPVSDQIKSRLTEDERIFTYAERTLRYYDECAKAYQLVWSGKKAEARRHYDEARRIAEQMRQDIWPISPEHTFHKMPLEGKTLTATNAPQALEHLGKLLEEPSTASRKPLNDPHP